jgi:hypothetical protein
LFCTIAADATMLSSWSGPPDTDTGMPRGSLVNFATASQSIFSLRFASSFWID